jgi:hypothetical protein
MGVVVFPVHGATCDVILRSLHSHLRMIALMHVNVLETDPLPVLSII